MVTEHKVSNGYLPAVRIRQSFLIDLSAFLFFSSTLVLTVLIKVLGSDLISTIAAFVIIYGFAVVACCMNSKLFSAWDFVILYLGLLCFLGITLIIHPEYAYYYTRPSFGVWDHVLKPYRGIYAYFFIRLLKKPSRIKKVFYASGCLNLLYFVYQYVMFLKRGYWFGVSAGESGVEMDHSIQYAYRVLPYAIFFLYYAMAEKKLRYIIPAIITNGLIILAGSRGPLVCQGACVILYFILYLKNGRHKVLIIIASIIMISLFIAFYRQIIMMIGSLFGKSGKGMRVITAIIEGGFTNDSGRSEIWKAAIDMIRQHPILGYGFMGSRHVISNVIVAGYPHSIILEMLIDFGVIVGGVILIAMFVCTVRMLFSRGNEQWRELFLIFFSSSCGLFFSLTFWSVPSFWICLALAVNAHVMKRQSPVIRWLNTHSR